MNGSAFYNEHDGYAAQWLRNLGAAGHISPGIVDERSIRELAPADVVGFQRAHFFAGIGVWDYALQQAGWGSTPVWTGSCPCQPFSAAGKRKGAADDRHLWPEWFRLIRECRPAIILGEQVASAGDWLDIVSSNLEGEDYSFGAVVLGAHSVRAPHIRQRFYFVAHANERPGGQGCALNGGRHSGGDAEPWAGPGRRGVPRGLAHAAGQRRVGLDTLLWPEEGGRLEADLPEAAWRGAAGLVGNASGEGPQGRGEHRNGADERSARPAGLAGFWSDAEWLPCTDGKLRPVEPGTFPLARGAPARVGRLRAYGNALCAETARIFVTAVMEAQCWTG
jgi:DNA (cytosine-5)-methyltransferase 1